MIRNLLFDLDGTLVDSSGTITQSLGFALERAGVAVPTAAAVRAFIGRPLLDIFRDDFGMDDGAAEQAIAHYRSHYDRLGREGTRVYDGVAERLPDLQRAGFHLFVATVKPGPIAERVLRDFGLDAHFRGISGSTLDNERRRKADIIGHALTSHALAAPRSLMIGDRAEDVFGARQHGVAAIGVAYGYGGHEELTRAGALHVAGSFAEVARLLLEGRTA